MTGHQVRFVKLFITSMLFFVMIFFIMILFFHEEIFRIVRKSGDDKLAGSIIPLAGPDHVLGCGIKGW